MHLNNDSHFFKFLDLFARGALGARAVPKEDKLGPNVDDEVVVGGVLSTCCDVTCTCCTESVEAKLVRFARGAREALGSLPVIGAVVCC
mmetsp:Transcript_14819/g.17657  ORF Transcript_14819/g.17657 Transcript_14819/m.17657 type:complete len:89 (+) Transcript_14819:90-356(+)